MSNCVDVLPDSRLREPKGTAMVDWPLPSGKTVRVEAEKVFCANCGVPYGYVPKENTAFTCWLCNQCFEQYGAVAGTFAVPDEQFCRAVEYEMTERFGRALTDLEILAAMDQGKLGSALEKLARESPYPVYEGRK